MIKRQIIFEKSTDTAEADMECSISKRATQRKIVFVLEDISNIPRPPDTDGGGNGFLISKMEIRERRSRKQRKKKIKSANERRLAYRKKMQQIRFEEEMKALKYLEARNLPLTLHEKQILKIATVHQKYKNKRRYIKW